MEAFPLLHDPVEPRKQTRWLRKLPFLGYWLQLRAEHALVTQPAERGPVPEAVWNAYSHPGAIRRQVEEIVIRHAYPKGSTFHPLDPIELMFVLRYGDLNEVCILMDIERELGLTMDDELVRRLIVERTTFIDFIRMVATVADKTNRSWWVHCA